MGAGLLTQIRGRPAQVLFMGFDGGQLKLVEVAKPASLSSRIDAATAVWSGLWPRLEEPNGKIGGIWWNEQQQRLWTTLAIDYPGDASAGNHYRGIHTRSLGSNGSVSTFRGPWKLEGVGQRRMYGGFQAVPQWFQTQYGTGPYAAG